MCYLGTSIQVSSMPKNVHRMKSDVTFLGTYFALLLKFNRFHNEPGAFLFTLNVHPF